MTETSQKDYCPPFEILFEDNHIIVVLKPQMTACCPDESKDDNLLDQIKPISKLRIISPETPMRAWCIVWTGPRAA